MILVDTSAFYAVADASDSFHSRAVRVLESLAAGREPLATHSFVVAETAALLHRRLGHAAAARFLKFIDGMEVIHVDSATFGDAVSRYLKASPSDLSLVDCVSFSVIRQRSIPSCFTFDSHFRDQGISLLPGLTSARG